MTIAKPKLLFAMAAIVALAPLPALAWSEQGHMTTGAIAYDDLAATAPATIAAIEALMADHPDAARFQTNLGARKGADRARAMFKWMARWPDDIRETAYDRPEWHYGVRLVGGLSGVYGREHGEARAAFARNHAIAANASAKAADRAVALCWLFHIIGDMQQPLHAGHWSSLRFPLSDRAGTTSFARKTPNSQPEKMHELWDFILDVPGDHAAAADVHAARIKALYPRARLPELMQKRPPAQQFGIWADESMHLAAKIVYQREGLDAVRIFGGVPVLSPRYVAIAHRLGSRRVAGGGYRIADTMRAIFAVTPPR